MARFMLMLAITNLILAGVQIRADRCPALQIVAFVTCLIAAVENFKIGRF